MPKDYTDQNKRASMMIRELQKSLGDHSTSTPFRKSQFVPAHAKKEYPDKSWGDFKEANNNVRFR